MDQRITAIIHILISGAMMTNFLQLSYSSNFKDLHHYPSIFKDLHSLLQYLQRSTLLTPLSSKIHTHYPVSSKIYTHYPNIFKDLHSLPQYIQRSKLITPVSSKIYIHYTSIFIDLHSLPQYLQRSTLITLEIMHLLERSSSFCNRIDCRPLPMPFGQAVRIIVFPSVFFPGVFQ